jgi:hypothetical protein
MTKALLLLAALLVTSLYAGVAGADSMPACSAGTRLVTNPVPSGARHHGGGRCEPDPAAKKSGCATSPQAPLDAALVGGVLFGLVALRAGRRRR